ncbi:MAG: DUF4249 domain-containing protein [Bacteroidota bacterium]|nr:DUF4249 domain-containing protein [Bacteroidota bacterium]
MKKGFCLWVLIMGLLSCEKTLNIEPNQQSPKLVVDAEIENGKAPLVALSHSLDYFSTIDTATLNNSFVHNATVTLSDGSQTIPLQEYKLSFSGGYAAYYYSTAPGNLFTGTMGKTYSLTIQADGKTYEATTGIPLLTKRIDSLWWKPAPFQSDSIKAVLMSRITDPPGYGNYIRYFTQTNQGPFFPGLNSVFDDQIIDGKTYDIQVDRGVNRNEKLDTGEYGFFKRGDTVTVKFCNIDKATYDFWRTWEFSYQSIGNPFSSPGKVLGNISNGALGSFCGYAAQYRKLIIPK